MQGVVGGWWWFFVVVVFGGVERMGKLGGSCPNSDHSVCADHGEGF